MRSRYGKSVVVTAIVLATAFLLVVGSKPVYALCTFTAGLSSSSIVQGGSVSVIGNDTCGGMSGEAAFFNIFTGACPLSGTGLPSGTQVGGNGLNPVAGTYTSAPLVFFVGQGGPGTYCVQVFSASVPSSASVDLLLTITGAAPIPEYPLGLPLVAMFMLIGYGLIKRRTRNDKT